MFCRSLSIRQEVLWSCELVGWFVCSFVRSLSFCFVRYDRCNFSKSKSSIFIKFGTDGCSTSMQKFTITFEMSRSKFKVKYRIENLQIVIASFLTIQQLLGYRKGAIIQVK